MKTWLALTAAMAVAAAVPHAPPAIRFTDVTAAAGIKFTHNSGRAGKKWLPETMGSGCAFFDANGDGWSDILLINSKDWTARGRKSLPALYRNNRDGTFTDLLARVAPRAPYSSMGSDLGDVDNDGRLDLLVSDMAATDHVKDQRTMAETRARMRAPAEGTSEIRQFPFSAVYLDTGSGRLLEAAHLAGLAATDWTWSPRWEDLDNDGRVDLHVTNGMYREIHNQDLIGRRSNAASASMREQVTRSSPVLAETNFAFRNRGELQFENVSTTWGLGAKGVSFGSALGDLDGDGDLDLLYSNYQSGVTLLRNDSDSGHRVICELRGTGSNRLGVGAEVRLETAAGGQVRVLALARGFMSSSEPIVHFGLGEEAVVRRLTVIWPSGARQVFENLPADRRFTITEPAAPVAATAAAVEVEVDARPAQQFIETAAASHLSWTAAEEPYDEFLDQRLLPAGLNRRGPAIAVGDLDGSGRDGVCLGGTTREALRVLRSDGANTWASVASPALAAPPAVDDGPILLFDATGRGHADLLVTAGGASQPADAPDYQARLFLNDGQGHFEPAPDGTLPPLAISAGAACTADFDRDGRLDVFIGARVSPGLYPAAPASVLLTPRDGKFVDATEAVAPMLRKIGLVTAALWSDVDVDGWPDLLVVLEWGGIRFLHNDGGKRFDDWTEKAGFAVAGTGWWRSLATADFNGDGRPDYAVGNLGLNTPYQAAAEQPALLFSGDFGGRGGADLIEAYYENGRLYPRRSRTDLGAALATVFRRYRANNDYARATLPEIVGDDRLAVATRLAATELRSGVLLSQSDGTYHFEPWPRIAQIAPANGLVAGDIDGDGHADLYVVHNSYAPAPAVGRFDGGLGQLLRGDGHGHFTAVPAAESGLIVPGDAKALAVLDLDGDAWPDFLVSRNGDSTLAFHNRGIAGRHPLRVVLRGRPGNPHAIGARVTAEHADGSAQTAEVVAGAGCYSQSTPALFFGSTEQNPVRRIRVTWPSGATSTSDELKENRPATVRLTQP